MDWSRRFQETKIGADIFPLDSTTPDPAATAAPTDAKSPTTTSNSSQTVALAAGAGIGVVVGFLLGGPVGGFVGGALGAGAGYLATRPMASRDGSVDGKSPIVISEKHEISAEAKSACDLIVDGLPDDPRASFDGTSLDSLRKIARDALASNDADKIKHVADLLTSTDYATYKSAVNCLHARSVALGGT